MQVFWAFIEISLTRAETRQYRNLFGEKIWQEGFKRITSSLRWVFLIFLGMNNFLVKLFLKFLLVGFGAEGDGFDLGVDSLAGMEFEWLMICG